MKQAFLLLLFVSWFVNSFSQNKKSNRWYFGNYVGINFNNNPPTTSNGSNMFAAEGCAAMSDCNGQLLFYSNGVSIWKRNHQVMNNGGGLLGGFSSTQAVLILPKPGNNNIYYVFTTSDNLPVDSFRYSIVDMTLDNGFGDVVAKNIALHKPVAEKLEATVKPNGLDYWIVVKELGTDVFLSYSLTSAGVDPNPVISHSGIVIDPINNTGYARISGDRSKIAVANLLDSITQLFDFDNNTGLISNPIDLIVADFRPYGVEFSPDNSKLYISSWWTGATAGVYIITQYNLAAGSPAAIQNSGVELVHQVHNPIPPLRWVGALKLAPNDKIYVSRLGESYLAAIQQPNLLGMACNYDTMALQLSPGTTCAWGLPSNIRFPLSMCLACPAISNVNSSITICASQTYQLPSGTIVNAAGIYHDTIRNVAGTCDSIIYNINISMSTVSLLNTFVHICSGQTYQLPSGTIINAEGTYIDTIRNQAFCDSIINTIHLFVDHVLLENTEAHICAGQVFMLPSGTIVNTEGIYLDTLRSQASCDSIINTVHLWVDNVSFLNTDAHICPGQVYTLPSGEIVETAGVYSDTLRSQAHCDSIINSIHLVVSDLSFTNQVDSIFTGQNYTLPSGVIVSAPGTYQSALTNSLGCDSVITTTLILRKTLAECITLKNAITPNGDGINDYWVLYKYICFKKLDVSVYNRYGSLVYHSDDYKNDWNGRYKNKELPDGTYYYVMKVFAFDGKEHVFRDNLTILR